MNNGFYFLHIRVAFRVAWLEKMLPKTEKFFLKGKYNNTRKPLKTKENPGNADKSTLPGLVEARGIEPTLMMVRNVEK